MNPRAGRVSRALCGGCQRQGSSAASKWLDHSQYGNDGKGNEDGCDHNRRRDNTSCLCRCKIEPPQSAGQIAVQSGQHHHEHQLDLQPWLREPAAIESRPQPEYPDTAKSRLRNPHIPFADNGSQYAALILCRRIPFAKSYAGDKQCHQPARKQQNKDHMQRFYPVIHVKILGDPGAGPRNRGRSCSFRVSVHRMADYS